MHPRVRLALVWGGLGAVVLLAFALGRARRPPQLGDRRPSTFLTGPAGARGLADALEQLDVRVERWRGRLRELVATPETDAVRTLALLDPGRGLEATEVMAVAGWHQEESGGLILVGPGTDPLMQCFGWATGQVSFSPAAVHPPGDAVLRPAEIGLFLVPDSTVVTADPGERLCEPVSVQSVDTVLVADDGRVAVVRMNLFNRRAPVVLMSDADLVRNRTLRDSDIGPLVLRLFAEEHDIVIFDESGHGFGTSGSLAGAVLAWSRRSPWGWAVWQLSAVGLLALLAGAVRFGPVRSILERRRRSPLEHVTALATALTAARGHDVAIAALVRGLRRRLVPNSPSGSDPAPWLRELSAHAPTPAARERAERLLGWTRPGQPAPAVLAAAVTVEELWEDLQR
jgi:hypothetical protein